MIVGRRRFIIAGAAALGAITLCSGCNNTGSGPTNTTTSGGSDAPPTPVAEWRIGAYLPLTGQDAQYGVDTQEGIMLAVDEVNKAGGARGRPLKVLFEDDKTSAQEASNKVLQLIDRDKVIALLGEVTSARSMPGGIVANKKKVPMITTSTNAEVTKIGPFIFRNCFTDEVQGKWGADFVVNKLGKKRLAVIFASDDLYSSGLAQEFRAHAKTLGAEIVIEKSFLKAETNFTTYVNEIKDKKPDIIYAPIYHSAMVPLARQAKAAGVKGNVFVGGDGWDTEELLKDAGDELEGSFFTNHYAPDVPWENSKNFIANYQARFKHAPSGAAALGYDAALILSDAIRRAKGDTTEDLRQAIQDTKDFQGVSGVTTVDSERNADKSVVIVQIREKSFKFYTSVNDRPPAAPPTTSQADGTPNDAGRTKKN